MQHINTTLDEKKSNKYFFDSDLINIWQDK